jgi:hypothetical protein
MGDRMNLGQVVIAVLLLLILLVLVGALRF